MITTPLSAFNLHCIALFLGLAAGTPVTIRRIPTGQLQSVYRLVGIRKFLTLTRQETHRESSPYLDQGAGELQVRSSLLLVRGAACAWGGACLVSENSAELEVTPHGFGSWLLWDTVTISYRFFSWFSPSRRIHYYPPPPDWARRAQSSLHSHDKSLSISYSVLNFLQKVGFIFRWKSSEYSFQTALHVSYSRKHQFGVMPRVQIL